MANFEFVSFVNNIPSADYSNFLSGFSEIGDGKRQNEPPALLNDMLGLDFDPYSLKDEMIDLFAPSSINGSDDLLDKLICELDKVEHESATNVFVSNYEPVVANNFLDNTQNHINFETATIDPFWNCVENSASSSGTNETFFFDQSLPQPAETVEIEYVGGAEHSYATSDEKSLQPHHNFVVTNDDKPSNVSLSPFSSSSSIRSTSSESGNGCSWQFANTKFNLQKFVKTHQKVQEKFLKSPSNECEDDNNDEDNLILHKNDFPLFTQKKSFATARLGSLFDRGSRRKIKSQFGAHDFRREDRFSTLLLSDEERELCEKEGVKLPTKFPLTKQEERDLHRIRRKIRNKRSAQESRRKKHEYISSLEDRIVSRDRENHALRRQVESLSKSNKSLAEQLRRLQNVVGNGSIKPTVQAGTCLAVLLLSFALLVAPNYNLFGKRGKMNRNTNTLGNGRFNENFQTDEESKLSALNSAKLSENQAIYPGNTRTLLQVADEFEYVDSAYNSDDMMNVSTNNNIKENDAWPINDNGGGVNKRPASSLVTTDDDYWWHDDSGGGGVNDDTWLIGLPGKRIKMDNPVNDSWRKTSSVMLSGRGVKVEDV